MGALNEIPEGAKKISKCTYVKIYNTCGYVQCTYLLYLSTYLIII